MKSIIFTVVAICLLSLSAFGQTEKAKNEAIKIDEVGEGIGCDWNTRLARLRDEGVFNSEASIGLLIYEGVTDKPQIYLQQLKSINKEIDFVGIDRAKIKIIDGGFRETYTVEFWIVPEGAENPKPTIYAEKVSEFGADLYEVKELLQSLRDKMGENPLLKAFIVNYGTKKQRVLRMKNMKKAVNFLSLDESRIQIVDGGTSKILKTEFWIVPPKSEK
jgi:hypothetical protein